MPENDRIIRLIDHAFHEFHAGAVDWPGAAAGGGIERDAGTGRDPGAGDDQALVRSLRHLWRIAEFNRLTIAGEDPARTPGATASEGSAALPARRWGELELRESIGSGAHAEVFRAWDPTLEREIALKLFPEVESAERRAQVGRVVTEGRMLAKIRHQNVVTVHGAAEHDGRAGIWMDLIEGESLESLITRQGPLAAGEAALIGVDLCRALAAVHGQELVHQDLKTQNVMREEGGRIVLMDFGVSSEIGPAADGLRDVAGTPYYMAPELVLDPEQRASPVTDVYALGVVLFRLVTGRYPVEARDWKGLEANHRGGASRLLLRDLRPELPARFVDVVEKAIATDPRRRHQSAGEMEQALRGVHPLTTAGAPSRRPRLQAGRLAIALALLAAVLLPLSIWFAGHQASYSVEAALYRWTPQGQELLDNGDRIGPGDRLLIELATSKPIWVYVANQDDLGNISVNFPLSGVGYEMTNPVPAGGPYRLPGRFRGRQLSWGVDPGGGTERFLIMASPTRLLDFEEQLAALPVPRSDRPQTARPLRSVPIRRARRVGELEALPEVDESPLESRLRTLYQTAAVLEHREEHTSGTWVRRIELANPEQ